MSGLTIRPAQRSSAKPIIGLYAPSGTGKTLSALLLARGHVGPNGKIVMIESESGRGEAHMDTKIGDSYVGGFEVIPLDPVEGFSPERYGQAISLAEQSGADALIIDSASHEWEGPGGVLHMAALNQEAGKKGPLVWQQPKISHQRHFVGRLLQTSIPLVIVCMRAKLPMREVEVRGKKEWQRSDTLEPTQSDAILFELFVHGWLDENHCFHGTKYTKPELASVLPSGVPFTNATGAALARWAAGDLPEAAPPADAPVASLSAIVAAIRIAESIEHLQAVGLRAKTLPEEDKGAAQMAYKERLAQLKAATDAKA